MISASVRSDTFELRRPSRANTEIFHEVSRFVSFSGYPISKVSQYASESWLSAQRQFSSGSSRSLSHSMLCCSLAISGLDIVRKGDEKQNHSACPKHTSGFEPSC